MSLATYVDYPIDIETIADRTNAPDGLLLTGTALDNLLILVLEDQGLNARVNTAEIQTAVTEMAKLNAIIVNALHETGLAADGDISTPDMFALSDHIAANYSAVWIDAHGDDENGTETGFHLVQNDGATTIMFGENMVNTVLDGLYHLGFGTSGNNLINEDGNRNAQVDDAAFWLNALLAKDVADGVFAADTPLPSLATTGTGLDAIVAMILTDERLNQRLPLDDLRGGAEAANAMNEIIIDGIKALGLANDGSLSASNVMALSDWIAENHSDAFITSHGDDENGVETGFHLVQNDGANTRLFGENGVNTVADGIYHLVFGYTQGRLINEDGNKNASLEDVADWLNRLLVDDMETLANPEVSEVVAGTTGTGLDRLVTLIVQDEGLRQSISDADLNDGATAANTMNTIIVEGIESLGLGSDGTLTSSEIVALSDWIAETHRAAFTAAHGDDENDTETGFHLVQNDGAVTRLFGANAVNTIADGIYHLVFGTSGDRLINEDGNRNARIESVAYWLNELLSEDLADWQNAAAETPVSTGLDQLVSIIAEDAELNNRLPLSEILDGMEAAQGMNAIIIEAIKETGVAANGIFSAADVREVSDWINTNRLADWITLHGDDEAGVETGFHLVQNDGATTRLFAQNAVNTVADGIYHLGFGYSAWNLINEDGNRNAGLDTVASWLNALLADDLASGALVGAADPYDIATTGTGLDILVENVMTDEGLAHKFSVSELAEAANAMDGLNTILLQAIRATGAANNGEISDNDVRLISDWIAENAITEWDALIGEDNTDSDGFLKLRWEGGTSLVGGALSLDNVARGLYALGHDIRWDTSVYDENNRWTTHVGTVAESLNLLLADDLENGSLINTALLAVSPATFTDALVLELDSPVEMGEGQSATLISHTASQELSEGAIAITFTAESIDGWTRRTLVSKDYRGNEDGGHLTVSVIAGKIEVIAAAADETYKVYSPAGMFRADQSTDLVVNFGADGLEVYIDGELAIQDSTIQIDWTLNDNPIAIGESRLWAWNDGLTDGNQFDGVIETVQLYNRNLTQQEVAGLDTALAQTPPEAETLGVEAVRRAGDGLNLDVYDVSSNFQTVDSLIALVKAEDAPSHVGTLTELSYSGAKNQQLTDFLGDGGAITSGDGAAAMDKIGFHATGYVWLDGGEHTFAVRSDDGFSLSIGGTEILAYVAPRSAATSSTTQTFEAGLYEVDLYYYDNGGAQVLEVSLDGEVLDSSSLYSSVEAYEAGSPITVDGPVQTGTGLDQIIEWIESDDGLARRTTAAERAEAIDAVNEMNAIIIEAIKATGAADGDALTTGEVMDIATWINANRLTEWTAFHGDDEAGVETGFHLVQNDGASTYAFGRNAINTIADGIYHLGFGYSSGNRLINEDGNNNARVEEVTYWLNDLLADDLANGTLASSVVAEVSATTGTGLDALVEIAAASPELNRNIAESELIDGTEAMNTMNALIIEGIQALGLFNDGQITAAEVAGLSDWIRADATRLATFIEAHGDDEAAEETGFHLIQNDGSRERLYAQNAINTVADGIYHLPFGYNASGRLINEDGNANASLNSVGEWLTNLLSEDAATLANTAVSPVLTGTTGTGLDLLVGGIGTDLGLQERITLAEINDGAAAANGMNQIIVESIQALGYANDGTLLESEVRGLAEYIKANYVNGNDGIWLTLHGDDENNEETGFHLVQNDGARTRLFNENLVNTVADGIYHLGFGYNASGRLINEDGNSNQTIADVTDWLNTLLADDMTNLMNADVTVVSGTTGTGLDQWVDLIPADIGLNQKISVTEITTGAQYADQINAMIVDGIMATGIARNGSFSAADIRVLSDYIAETYYGGSATSSFAIAHGDDESGVETGFHLVQNDGATAEIYGENLVNTVLDGVYHLGFGYNTSGRLINEDGNSNQKLTDVAYWLEAALEQELLDGSLVTGDSATPYVTGSTGTGLDDLVDLITNDDQLQNKLGTDQIADAARAADGLNALLLEAIIATNAADDGALTTADLKEMSAYIQDNHSATWAALNGDSSSGFTQAMDAQTALYGERAVRTVMDGLYNLGFGYKWDRVVTETGGTDERLSDVAVWLSDLLATELSNGSLAGQTIDAQSFDADPLFSRTDLSIENKQDAELRYLSNSGEGSVVTRFTLEDDASGKLTLFQRGAWGDTDGYFRLYVQNGDLRLEAGQNGQLLSLKSEGVTIETGTDYTAAVSYDGDSVSIYLNGAAVDVEVNPGIDFGQIDDELMLGASFSMGSEGQIWPWNAFEGTIEAVSVYDTAFSTAEMAYLDQSGTYDRTVTVDTIALAATTAADGDGLNGALFDVDSTLGSIADYRETIAGTDAALEFVADELQFSSRSYGTVQEFVESGGSSISGEGTAVAETFGLSMDGFIFVEAGTHTFDVTSDDGFSMTIGGTVVAEYAGLRGSDTTHTQIVFSESGFYAIELDYFEDSGGQILEVEMDGALLDEQRLFTALPDLV
ncbi:LamG-like jellyroll fold domain-containing protein [Donghicola sp. XS_ASV15]|uniref:LamG-like jellyroll fold domain-containing protein n=1 Tax=Donghicola sp. XS_ASV15 TaxID=3241295 RepID=UPI0035182345